MRRKNVIAGSDFSSCDCAIDLVEEDKEVTLVEMLDKVTSTASLSPQSSIDRMLEDFNIKVYTNTNVLGFNDDSLKIKIPEDELQFERDTVIVAFGAKPTAKVTKSVFDAYWNAVQSGDCLSLEQIGEAVRAVFFAGKAS